VTAWIDLDDPAAGLAWSPDGTKLLATTYDRDPTTKKWLNKARTLSMSPPINRTGYYLVDALNRTAVFHPETPPSDLHETNAGDLGWSEDGTRIWAAKDGEPYRTFYDLDGNPASAPPGWSWENVFQAAGISPDGKLAARDGKPPGPQTTVIDVATGQVVGTQTMEQLVAWADDTHLVALKCAGTCQNEFNNAYVLVAVDGTEIAQLTGYRDNSQKPGAWEPVFTLR
jgi:hypothetical protein